MNARADGRDPVDGHDSLRDQLLKAAARVFASKGYAGTKILDITREAGLSSGAVYGRFESKKALLIEAVVTAAIENASERIRADRPVADFIVGIAADRQGPLTDTEAIQLEAYVAARREPEVADAVAKARRRWRRALKPMVEAARADGTVAREGDVESIVYFLETVHLGLLLQRGAGIAPPNASDWKALIRQVVRTMSGGSAKARRAR